MCTLFNFLTTNLILFVRVILRVTCVVTNYMNRSRDSDCDLYNRTNHCSIFNGPIPIYIDCQQCHGLLTLNLIWPLEYSHDSGV